MIVNFIGPYMQNDGWGNAAKAYLRALTLCKDIDLSITPVQYSQMADTTLEGFISFLEEKEPGGDICIHNVLPPGDVTLGKKNLWLGYTETRHSIWFQKIKNYDGYIFATELEKQYAIEAGLNNIHVIPTPIDFDRMEKIKFVEHEKLTNNYVFYTVSDWNWRKNIDAAIVAYWREFKSGENVKLLLKLRVGTTHEKRLQDAFLGYLNQLKATYRMFDKDSDYPEIYIVTEFVNFQELANLHWNANCLIVPSRGESTCIPLRSALYFNNDVICTNNIGCCEDWMDIRRVNSVEVPCNTKTPPIADIYSGRETCREIDILDLQKHMRESYEQQTTTNCRDELIKRHDYSTAAKSLDDVLQGMCVC